MKYPTLFPLIVLLLFASCDPGTIYERILVNMTDKDIDIVFHHQAVNEYPNGSLRIKANSTELLFKTHRLGGYEEPINPVELIDSVDITIDGAVLTKDVLNPENWFARIRRTGIMKKGADHKYYFSVTNSDLQ